MVNLADRLAVIRDRIGKAALRVGRRPEDVQLMIVSKQQPVSMIQELIDLHKLEGSRPVFGESYVQEYRVKRESLHGEFECHLIGALQRNKVKGALKIFDVIGSLHSIELAYKLNSVAKLMGIVVSVFLQVNISNDSGKFGFKASEVEKMVFEEMPSLQHLHLAGLMTITKQYYSGRDARRDYVSMAKLRDVVLDRAGVEGAFPIDALALSMGMSDDFEMAIEEGSSLVRLGSALFGERVS